MKQNLTLSLFFLGVFSIGIYFSMNAFAANSIFWGVLILIFSLITLIIGVMQINQTLKQRNFYQKLENNELHTEPLNDSELLLIQQEDNNTKNLYSTYIIRGAVLVFLFCFVPIKYLAILKPKVYKVLQNQNGTYLDDIGFPIFLLFVILIVIVLYNEYKNDLKIVGRDLILKRKVRLEGKFIKPNDTLLITAFEYGFPAFHYDNQLTPNTYKGQYAYFWILPYSKKIISIETNIIK